MNEIFLNNPFFLTLSKFGAIFFLYVNDLQELNSNYPNKLNPLEHNISKIEISDLSKSPFANFTFKFSKTGNIEYCGKDRFNEDGFTDTRHEFDKNGILKRDISEPMKSGDKFSQDYSLVRSKDNSVLEFSFKESLIYGQVDSSKYKPSLLAKQKIFFDKKGKILKFLALNTSTIGPLKWADTVVEEYHYSNDGLLESMFAREVKNSEYTKQSKYFLKYDENKNMTDFITGDINTLKDTLNMDKPLMWYFYSYDKNKNLIRECKKNENYKTKDNIMHTTPVCETENVYDSKGKLVKVIWISKLGQRQTTYYEYSKDLISKKTVIDANKGDTLSNIIYNYTFYK